MICDRRRALEIIVGLPDVRVLGVDDGEVLVVHVEQAGTRPACAGCGEQPAVKERDTVLLVDLPCFGRRTRLAWRKFRFSCRNPGCDVRSFTWTDERIAAPRQALTDRAARWATVQVGKLGRTVKEVAGDLGCDWHTVLDAVVAYGTPLVDDQERIGDTEAMGLDETLFLRRGPFRSKEFCTSIVDVGADSPQLLDVVEGRDSGPPSEWIRQRPQAWRQRVKYGTLDLSGPYRKTFNDTLPHVTQVADPFHLVKLANSKVDEVRRRVQNDTFGHRGHRYDPLYRARRLLTKAHERIGEQGEQRLRGLLEAGDPKGEVRMAWHAKEVVRSIYEIDDIDTARQFVSELSRDLRDDSCPPEVRTLGRTIGRWIDQIVAWHEARVTNGPTEGANNLIKRIKRVGFGFRNFATYRIRVLLYAGRPNWDLLATVRPR